MRLADRSTSLKTQQVAGPCRAKVKLPAEPVVIILSRTALLRSERRGVVRSVALAAPTGRTRPVRLCRGRRSRPGRAQAVIPLEQHRVG